MRHSSAAATRASLDRSCCKITAIQCSTGISGWFRLALRDQLNSPLIARPSELLEHLFGFEFVQPGIARLVRERVVFGPPR